MTYAAIVPLAATVPRTDVFTPLAGMPALIRAVRMLAEEAGADVVLVAVAAALADEARAALSGVAGTEVVSVDGAGRRLDCLHAGLDAVRNRSTPPHHVLVHDCRRPLTPPAVVRRVRAALADGAEAVIPALPFTDSAKTVDASGSITATLDRATLRTAQHPRGFPVDRLAQLLDGADSAADELLEAQRVGLTLTLVDGDPDGFVVRLPDAASLVEAVITARAGRI